MKARDFLLSAATVAVSFIGTPLAGAELASAVAARTALVLGVQTYARAQQRKAQRRAASAVQDNTVTLRTNEYPEFLVFGTARVPTQLAYRCNHGDKKQFLTQVLIVPCRHELTAIDDILFDGVSIGPLDANGYVQSGSRWFSDTVSMRSAWFTGGNAGLTLTLPEAGSLIVSIDTIAVTLGTTLTSGSGEGATVYNDTSRDRVLGSSEYTVSGNVITLSVTTNDLSIAVTYRARTGGKAWVRVQRHLGSAAGFTPTVDGPQTGGGTTLITASNGVWRSSDALQGVPAVVVTCEYDPTGAMWAAGLPQAVTLLVRGLKLYDPTKDSTNGGSGAHRLANPATWEFSNNAALCLREYLRREVGCGASEIDDASFRAAVPKCAALVTLRSGATEPAFTCDGIVSTADTWADNIERLAMTMIGNAVLSGNVWSVEPYGWTAPTLSLPEPATADGEVKIESRPGLDEIINAVRGRCLDNRATAESPLGAYTMEDFPPRKIDAYVTEDEGRTYWHDVELPLSAGFERAQRLAIFYAHAARQGMIVRAPFNTDAYQTRPGQRLRLPWAANGWDFSQDGGTGKIFKILERRLEPPSRLMLTLREDAASIYSWDYTAAVGVDPTPQTALPPPNYVASVVLLSVTSDATTFVRRTDGTVIGYVAFEFQRPAQDDVYVVLYWKRAQETEFRRVRGRVGDTQLNAEGVTAGEVLNAYLVAYNGLGAPSVPTWVPVLVVGENVPSSAVLSVENMLKGTTFEFGTGECVKYANGNGIGAEHVQIGKHPSPGYYVPGVPSSAWMVVDYPAGAPYASTALMIWPEVVVQPGARYAVYANLIGWGTDASMYVAWRDKAGNFIRDLQTAPVAGVPVESGSARWDNPAHYGFTGEFVVAPENAFYAAVAAAASGVWDASERYRHISVYKPFFGRVPQGVTLLPPWNAGAVSAVGTAFLAPEAATAVREVARSAALSVTPFIGATPAVSADFVALGAQPGEVVRWTITGVLSVPASTSVKFNTTRVSWSSVNAEDVILGPGDRQPITLSGSMVVWPTPDAKRGTPGVSLYMVSNNQAATLHAAKVIVEIIKR